MKTPTRSNNLLFTRVAS